jgi:hypothetical protein
MRLTRTFLTGAGALLAMSSLAATKPEQASIPFATSSGIEGWRPVGDDTLYIRGRNDQWYKADLFGPCIGLEFDPTIGFVVRYGSSFDRSSSILVEGRECRVSSLVEVAAPPDEGKGSDDAHVQHQAKADASQGKPRSADDAGGSAQPASLQTRIPFANFGGIEDWRAVNDELLYVEGRDDQWYRVDLFAPCTGLRFEQSVGFVAEPTGSFDRFSSIVVDGRECNVRSVTPGTPPGLRQAQGEGVPAQR